MTDTPTAAPEVEEEEPQEEEEPKETEESK